MERFEFRFLAVRKERLLDSNSKDSMMLNSLGSHGWTIVGFEGDARNSLGQGSSMDVLIALQRKTEAHESS
ncbi:MAG: hypothetical protein ACYDHD_04705 [Vulcanimicrobiaceae bacterium]